MGGQLGHCPSHAFCAMALAMTQMIDSVPGDATGLAIPAHGDALLAAGPEFLTQAFRRFGSLPADNSVTRIVRFAECPGGSTGRKFYMTLDYARNEPHLHRELFVKFSRDFTDERRDDPGRFEMASEALFTPLSRLPAFPIAVPAPYFADYHLASGTGLIITECVGYGTGNIEPHRRKTLDHLTLADPLAYYRQVVISLARLAGAHRSGVLGTGLDARFPFDPVSGSADPIRYSEAELKAELEVCFAYAADCPRLLPEEVRSADFQQKFVEDALLVQRHEATIQSFLTSDPRMIALCHWNTHIDNCWFWRDEAGALHNGLIDWGRVGQITFGSALWGGLTAAHNDIWDQHLESLLALFADEYHAHGGPQITVDELLRHLRLHVAAMGVARVLAFPETIRFRLPECTQAVGPLDPMFEPVAADPARSTMHVYAVFLKFWRKYDLGGAVRELIAR
jgi:hypothetical protein